jgi:hypothetical protein
MGGVAGHLRHVYEDFELSFGEIKKVFQKAASGALVGTVKVDGQNLFISYSVRRNIVVGARNKSDIKKGGSTIADFKQKYKDKPEIKAAFVDSLRSFERVAKEFTISQQTAIFGEDAEIYFNCEILDPKSPNVVRYDVPIVLIHRTGQAKFNKETGEVESIDVSGSATLLEKVLELITNKRETDRDFEIRINAIRTLKKLVKQEALEKALRKLNELMALNGLEDLDTIGDFVVGSLVKKLRKDYDQLPDNLVPQIIKKMIGVKGYNIKDILNSVEDEKIKLLINEVVDNSRKILAEINEPLILIVHDFSVEMLKGVQSTFILDPERETERIRRQVKQAIELIQKSNMEEAIEILEIQLNKIKNVENISTAEEGFVFAHNGELYKFTGNFAPINQILGLFRYGRGNIPPLSRLESETAAQLSENLQTTKERKVAVVPGSFKPPHVGHLEMVKKYADLADVVVILISPLPRKLPTGEDITFEMSKKIWQLYIDDANLSEKVKILKSPNNSPVSAVYMFVANEGNDPEMAQPGDSVIFGVSDKGTDKGRFVKDIQKYAKEGVKILSDPEYVVDAEVDSESGEELSAKDMRTAIAEKNISTFSKFLPISLRSRANEILSYFSTGSLLTENKNLKFLLESLISTEIEKDQPKVQRNRLPQINTESFEAFKHFLGKQKVAVSEKEALISELKPLQEYIDMEKVDFFLNKKNKSFLEKPLIVSSDSYILDGHHRWWALKSLDEEMPAKVLRVGLTAKPALEKIRQFSFVTYTGFDMEKNTHENLAEHVIHEFLLREEIQKILNVKYKKRTMEKILREAKEEEQFRRFCQSVLFENRDLILEAVEPVPHSSTGINVLKDLLKKIIPVLEADFKKLTTEDDQRKSFRAHIVNAVENSLLPNKTNEEAGEDKMVQIDESLGILNDELEVTIGNPESDQQNVEEDFEETDVNPEFIDIDKQEEEIADNFAIPGEDETGRNFASNSFKKIEKQIQEAYSLLVNDEDRDVFYDYLITNLKLYFDKFEDELKTIINEPSTDEYNDAKREKKTSL